MTRAPFVTAKSDAAWSRKNETYDTTFGWRFINPDLSKMYYPFGMGETAENVAVQYAISREAQDLFAFNSQEKYAAAGAGNKFIYQIQAFAQSPFLLLKRILAISLQVLEI